MAKSLALSALNDVNNNKSVQLIEIACSILIMFNNVFDKIEAFHYSAKLTNKE